MIKYSVRIQEARLCEFILKHFHLLRAKFQCLTLDQISISKEEASFLILARRKISHYSNFYFSENEELQHSEVQSYAPLAHCLHSFSPNAFVNN